MKKSIKRIVSTLAVLVLALIILPTTALAASSTQDGLEITLTTDKATYSAGETVVVNVAVKNTNGFAVNNVKLNLTLPNGLTLKSGSLSTSVISLAAGGSTTLTLTATASSGSSGSTVPQTGDGSLLSLWLALACVSGGIIALIILKKRKAAKLLSLILCFIITIGVIAPAGVAQAATVSKNFSTSETITVGGTTFAITAKVTYDWDDGTGLVTVTYDANGGTDAPTATVHNSGDTVTLSDVGGMTNGAKTFKGWNTDTNGKGAFYAAGATFTITADTVLYAMWSGDGTGNPIVITTKAELEAIANDLTKEYILVNDIDVGSAWLPIGNGNGTGASDMTNQFTGHFEGNGHTIYINGFTTTITPGISSSELLGLFGAIGTDGTVQNLMVTGTVSRTADIAKYIGGVAGWNGGTIQNCVVTASISGTSSDNTFNTVGGIAGINNNGGTILNCYTIGAVSATSTLETNAGGIAGYNWGIVDSCYATGAVSANGSNNYAGGIVGANGGDATSIVRNCVALNASVTQSIGTAYRVTDDPTMVNNRAIPISGLSGVETLDGRNGLTITTEQSRQQSTYSTDAGWKFGTDNSNPWVWDSVNNIPILYWEVW